MTIELPYRANAHNGYVQTITAGQHEGCFFAVCASCGWQGLNDRKTEAEAQQDLNDHISTTGFVIA